MPIVSGVEDWVGPVEPDAARDPFEPDDPAAPLEPFEPFEPFEPDDEQAVAASITTDTETASRRIVRGLRD